MATDNVVRVLFEAIIDKFKSNVQEVTDSITELGDKGKKTEKELEFKKPEKGLKSLSGKVKDTTLNTEKLGKEGKEAGNKMDDGFKKAESGAKKLDTTIKNVMKVLAVRYVAGKIKDFGATAITEFGKTQTALGELKSLGVEDLEVIRQAAINFSNTWSGTVREDFISASYAIKSGIASLSDEGVAKFTEMAALTAKATKATVNEMTNLFAQGFGIYRNQFGSDNEFAEKFSSGISSAIRLYRTSGTEMSGFISSLGASAEAAGRPLAEILAIGGELQTTMSGSESATQFSVFLKNVTKAGDKLNLSFVDSNNRLKSIPEIIDVIKKKYGNMLDALETQELAEAFGTKEAVDMIQLLYNKTDDVVNKTGELEQIMGKGSAATKEMADAMNKGILEQISRLEQRISNIFESIGEKIEPHLSGVFNNIFATLDNAASNGTIDRIGQSIGPMAAFLGELFNQMLQNAPMVIETATSAINWLSGNLEYLLELVKMGAQIWLGYKSALLLVNIATNPTIYIIGLLIGIIIKLYTESETARNVIEIAFEAVKLMVLSLAWLWVKQFQVMIDIVVLLIGWIPGIGDALKSTSDRIDGILTGINNKIADTANNIHNLMSGAKEASKGVSEIEPPSKVYMGDFKKADEESMKEYRAKMSGEEGKNNIRIPFEKSAVSLGSVSNGGSKASTDKRTAFEKGKDKVDENYKTREDLINSQITLEDTKENEKVKKAFQKTYIDMLNEKFGSYLGLEKLVSGNDEKNILETAKNKILTEIAKVTNDIKGGVEKLTGSFNAPSEITALTEYVYKTNNNSFLTRIISTPTMNMYLTVKDLGANSAAETRNKLNNFAGSFMGKDSIVYDGMKNVVKN